MSENDRQKVDELIAQIQHLSGEFARLSASALADETKLKLIEESIGRHEQEIRTIKDSTRQMQFQFDQIMLRINTLETNLFSWLQQLTKDGANERTTSQKSWMALLQFVLAGTIIAIVTYVFAKGNL